LIQMMPQELQDQYASNIPIKRAASPDEIAAVIVFLTSSDASYIVGQNIAVDGGLMATTGSPDHMSFFQKMYAGG